MRIALEDTERVRRIGRYDGLEGKRDHDALTGVHSVGQGNLQHGRVGRREAIDRYAACGRLEHGQRPVAVIARVGIEPEEHRALCFAGGVDPIERHLCVDDTELRVERRLDPIA
jgi:hypothetical protein